MSAAVDAIAVDAIAVDAMPRPARLLPRSTYTSVW
jgi:hypothetical protein